MALCQLSNPFLPFSFPQQDKERSENSLLMMKKTIYALGFFDGVHLGHQALLSACGALSEEHGCRPGVCTFIGHPDTLVLGSTPPLINTRADRSRLLRHWGMEHLVELPFDRAMMELPWQDFFQMLRTRYNAGGIVCGDDFRFGYRGQGTAQLLSAACQARNLPCAVIPQQKLDGVTLSSTYIRSQLECGDMETAVRFLGHPHLLTGTVISGRQLGRTLGIPTANLALPEGIITPRYGVYACKVALDGREYLAVTNVGNRPTVNGHRVTVEPWILDFDGDLYGREITLRFYRFLRPEQKFPGLEELKAEIRKNAEQTRKYFEKR